MPGRLKSFVRERRGSAVIEFALFIPMFLIVLVGVVEYGRVLAQTNAIEKGLRAGAMIAARSDYPLTDAQTDRILNIVMTGNIEGTLPYLVPGWAEAGAGVTIETDLFTSTGVVNLPVFRIEATVPYDPLLPGLMESIGLGELTITTAHEQGRVGY
jgi:Flp pilus assembly pilin Flp